MFPYPLEETGGGLQNMNIWETSDLKKFAYPLEVTGVSYMGENEINFALNEFPPPLQPSEPVRVRFRPLAR